MRKQSDEKKYVIMGVIFALGFFLPFTTRAATTMHFDVGNPVIHTGDTFLADLKISTPDASINVVDGTLLYDKSKLEIKEVSAGNSVFALWPQPPVFSNEKGSVRFVGGVPGGFQGDTGEVLKISFLAKSEGNAQVSLLDGFSVFLHDGKGTRINPLSSPLSLSILSKPLEVPAKDEWRDLIALDKTPPESFEIIVSKDPSVFDNHYFINFFTTDAQSGIAYYEVQEGQKDFVRAESPYLLQDQSLKQLIKVRAIDNAGNERTEQVMSLAPTVPFNKNILLWVVICIVIIVLFYVVWKNGRRKSKI